jgi:hypothetical protein
MYVAEGAHMTQDEFYEKIPEWVSKPKDTWNHITLMAYFCHKYEKVHGVRFRLVKWQTDPGKGKESRDFSRLFKTLAPENYATLSPPEKKAERAKVNIKIYNYINWIFDYKFRSGDRSVTGTKLFLIPSMVNEFERMYSAYLSKQRSENKFETLLVWAHKETPAVFRNHQMEHPEDVEMLQAYAKSYSLGSSSIEAAFLDKARELGLI